MAEVFSPSLRQNNLTKKFAEMSYCRYIYMKFKAMPMDHSLQHVPHFVRRKEMTRLCIWLIVLWIISGCCRKTLNS